MRDGAILAIQKVNASRDALMFEQFEFLETRQEAFERLAKVSSLWCRLLWLLWPRDLLDAADGVQVALIQSRRAGRQMRGDMDRARISS